MGNNRLKAKIAIKEARLEALKEDYDQILDEMVSNDNEANRSRERAAFQRMLNVKKEIQSLKNEVTREETRERLTDEEEDFINSLSDGF